jgi:hypothetical protein
MSMPIQPTPEDRVELPRSRLDDIDLMSHDPVKEFIDALPDDTSRDWARSVVAMRHEFVARVQRMLTAGSDIHGAVEEAVWVSRHAYDVARGWGTLMREVLRRELHRAPVEAMFVVDKERKAP